MPRSRVASILSRLSRLSRRSRSSRSTESSRFSCPSLSSKLGSRSISEAYSRPISSVLAMDTADSRRYASVLTRLSDAYAIHLHSTVPSAASMSVRRFATRFGRDLSGSLGTSGVSSRVAGLSGLNREHRDLLSIGAASEVFRDLASSGQYDTIDALHGYLNSVAGGTSSRRWATSPRGCTAPPSYQSVEEWSLASPPPSCTPQIQELPAEESPNSEVGSSQSRGYPESGYGRQTPDYFPPEEEDNDSGVEDMDWSPSSQSRRSSPWPPRQTVDSWANSSGHSPSSHLIGPTNRFQSGDLQSLPATSQTSELSGESTSIQSDLTGSLSASSEHSFPRSSLPSSHSASPLSSISERRSEIDALTSSMNAASRSANPGTLLRSHATFTSSPSNVASALTAALNCSALSKMNTDTISKLSTLISRSRSLSERDGLTWDDMRSFAASGGVVPFYRGAEALRGLGWELEHMRGSELSDLISQLKVLRAGTRLRETAGAA